MISCRMSFSSDWVLPPLVYHKYISKVFPCVVLFSTVILAISVHICFSENESLTTNTLIGLVSIRNSKMCGNSLESQGQQVNKNATLVVNDLHNNIGCDVVTDFLTT